MKCGEYETKSLIQVYNGVNNTIMLKEKIKYYVDTFLQLNIPCKKDNTLKCTAN